MELFRLRREIPSLSRLSKELLNAETMDDERVLVIHRWTEGSEGHSHGGEGSEILLLLHFGDTRAAPRIRLPAGSWKVILDSAAGAWGGPGSTLSEAVESEEETTAIPLEARSAVLFERAG